MAFNLSPLGVVNRPVPDWFASSLTGKYAVQSNVAGQNSYIGVYNNASDGSVIRVYCVNVGVSPSTFVLFEHYYGNPGTVYTAIDPQGAIDPRVPTAWGQIIAFSSAVCLGTHIGGLESYAGAPSFYAPGWPLGIIPPGYSFLVQTKNQNVTIEGAIYWLSAYN